MCKIAAIELDKPVVGRYPQVSVFVGFNVIYLPVWNAVWHQITRREYTEVVPVQCIVARHPYTPVPVGPNLLDVGVRTKRVDIISGCTLLPIEGVQICYATNEHSSVSIEIEAR